MTLPPEAIADRRRLTRRLVIWRSLAAFAAALAIVAWAGVAGLGDIFGQGGARVATLDLKGVIVSDADRRDALKAASEDDDVRALIVRIDSPGGTFVGSDALYRQLRAFGAKKPVVAVINDVAASGGYMAAIAADRIYASRGSITASVGVIFQTPRVDRLMESVGVDLDVWRSGDLKARPSPFEPTPPAAVVQAQAMVDRLFRMFIGMVKDRRRLDAAALAEVSDGRVVTGERAEELGLIDAIGDETAARDWLAAEKDVDDDLPAVDITPKPELERGGLLGHAMAFVLGDDRAADKYALSGLLAVWRPLAPMAELR